MKKAIVVFGLAVLVMTTIVSVSFAGTLFTADLTGNQEVPPTGSLATGHADMYLNHAETAIHIKLSVSNFTNTITASHIHRGASGVAGPVIFSIGAFTNSIEADWTNPSAGDIADLKAGNLYVNVHSNIFPGGEIRGQIGAPGSVSFEANLDGNQEVPPTGSLATGYGDITVTPDHANLHIELSVSNFTNTITASHIHSGVFGQNGPVVFPIGAFTGSTRADFAITSAQYLQFLNQGFYANVHSNIFPGGEIRGQIRLNSTASVGQGIVVSDLPSISGSPNPMHGNAVVHYSLPRSEQGEVSVVDVSGRLVRQLAAGTLASGSTSVFWDGRDQVGAKVPSGMYYYRMNAAGKVVSARAILIR